MLSQSAPRFRARQQVLQTIPNTATQETNWTRSWTGASLTEAVNQALRTEGCHRRIAQMLLADDLHQHPLP